MDNRKKSMIWLVIFIFIFIITCIITTYAYLNVRDVRYGSFNIEVTSKGVDILKFNSSGNADVTATKYNFAPETGKNLSASAEIDVSLNTTNPSATYCYEVIAQLPDEPVFTYSITQEPELVLTISKSSNQVDYIPIIDNLDITTKTGIIKVPTTIDGNEYINTIFANKNELVHNYWKATVTLLWFKDINQEINNNKNYSLKLKANRVEC